MNNHKEKDGEIRKHNLPFSKRKEGTEEKLKCTNRKKKLTSDITIQTFPKQQKEEKGYF